jgi:hypothetical protein
MRWRALAALVVAGENSAVLKHTKWKGGSFSFLGLPLSVIVDIRGCLGFRVKLGMEWEVEAA